MSDLKETVVESGLGDEVASKPEHTTVVNHVMYQQETIDFILSTLNSMSLTGAENMIRFAEVYKMLSTTGQIVPVQIPQ